jgi:hypothetical protein
VTAPARRGGQGPGLEQPHGPEPLVDPGLVHPAIVPDPGGEPVARLVACSSGSPGAMGNDEATFYRPTLMAWVTRSSTSMSG